MAGCYLIVQCVRYDSMRLCTKRLEPSTHHASWKIKQASHIPVCDCQNQCSIAVNNSNKTNIQSNADLYPARLVVIA